MKHPDRCQLPSIWMSRFRGRSRDARWGRGIDVTTNANQRFNSREFRSRLILQTSILLVNVL
jgi:hypothetical protein